MDFDFDSIVFTLVILLPVLIIGAIIVSAVIGSQPIINVVEVEPLTITHKIGELNVSIPQIYWFKFEVNQTKNKTIIVNNNDKFPISLILNNVKNENYSLIWDYDNMFIQPYQSQEITLSLIVYKENFNIKFYTPITYKVHDYEGYLLGD